MPARRQQPLLDGQALPSRPAAPGCSSHSPQVMVWNNGDARCKLVTLALKRAARGLHSGRSLASASSDGEAEGTEAEGMAPAADQGRPGPANDLSLEATR